MSNQGHRLLFARVGTGKEGSGRGHTERHSERAAECSISRAATQAEQCKERHKKQEHRLGDCQWVRGGFSANDADQGHTSGITSPFCLASFAFARCWAGKRVEQRRACKPLTKPYLAERVSAQGHCAGNAFTTVHKRGIHRKEHTEDTHKLPTGEGPVIN